MKFIFSALVFLAFSSPAFASISYDITCVEGDCWTKGWTLKDHNTGTFSDVECKTNSCFDAGWLQIYRGQISSESICYENGCWSGGAHFFDNLGRHTGGFQCNEDQNLGPNCLTAGWRMMDRNGNTTGEVECVAGDCEKFGWDIDNFRGPLQLIRCKDDSCFTNGWTLRQ